MPTEYSPASARKRLIIVGHGMVGHYLIEQLVDTGALADWDITAFGEEPERAYDRVHLTEYFDHLDASLLALGDGVIYEQGVTLRLQEAVIAIDRTHRTVTTTHGDYAYDVLVLATGSRPFVPTVPGAQGTRRYVYRTIDDVQAIAQAAKQAKRGVVIGGGLLGLEAANALKKLGLQTELVELSDRLMPAQLDVHGAQALRGRVEPLGVSLHLGKSIAGITDEGEAGLCMAFTDGSTLTTDIVVYSAGIRPNGELARGADLALDPAGGILVDKACCTEDPAIYAIGECASFAGMRYGLVAPGYKMARTVAAALCRQEVLHFEGADMSTKLKLLGIDVGCIGNVRETPGTRSYRVHDEFTHSYRRLIVSEDGKQLMGAILVGDNRYYDRIMTHFSAGLPLPKNPSLLISEVGDAVASADVGDFPDAATLCSCHNVTKGQVCAAIDGGCQDLGSLKKQTRASTGCGGCAVMLKQVFDHEMRQRGKEVDNSLCEHFGYTRQDLFSFVKIESIHSFEELLARHGRGRTGCDICKPAVASILASCWNEPVLGRARAKLQDTNDMYLANIQRDGTYSVVPRIPGGEITPEKLIVIGEVARKYDLYTKITGAQRIDLFGAQLDDLPHIWSELIAAGFESGHAYGKALRTVKSCVGSTWCRYGVQDSVAMALRLEDRYKGLRAPHKLKFAVSGCVRECAEAQSKDIGVIATENGWNLYVCGNGGIRPRHAELFATDLDDETLIRYIDRVLIFYIRTADKLQRTAAWRDKLEGGLDYLRAVVIDDSLGLAADFEAQMQTVIGAYHCEWREAVENPDIRRRFHSFVNTASADPTVSFVRERGQIRPARAGESAEKRLIEEVKS